MLNLCEALKINHLMEKLHNFFDYLNKNGLNDLTIPLNTKFK